MQSSRILRRRFLLGSALTAVSAFAQAPAVPDVQGLPARTAASDYLAQGKVGSLTIAGEFTGHAVPTMSGAMSSEDYVCVEVAFYGAAGAKMKLSFEEFSLRINGKKSPVSSTQFGLVMKSLSDPTWVPDVPVEKGSKGGLSTGGGGGQGDPKPAPPKMPFALRRAMEQKVQKAALPEGERALPVAGLLFFPYRGKDTSVQSVDLVYNGSAGNTVLTLMR